MSKINITGETKLHEAIKQNRYTKQSSVKLELVNVSTLQGETPLILSIKEGTFRITYSLLDCEPFLDWQDKEGNTALHYAVMAHALPIVRRLCDEGASTRLLNKKGKSAIHLAAAYPAPDVLKAILTRTEENINEVTTNWETPLIIAAKKGHRQVTITLLAKGADATISDTEGNNPLHWAAIKGHCQIGDLLLHTVDINCKNSKWKTPIAFATELGHNAMFQSLAQNGASLLCCDINDNSLLHLACLSDDTTILVYLLKHRIFRNSEPRNIELQTPLDFAVKHRKLNAIVTLVDNNASLNPLNSYGQTPLMTAIINDFTEIADFLLKVIPKHGRPVCVNTIDNMRNTPLHLCSLTENKTIAKILLKKGAKLDAYNSENKTPIHVLAERTALYTSSMYQELYKNIVESGQP